MLLCVALGAVLSALPAKTLGIKAERRRSVLAAHWHAVNPTTNEVSFCHDSQPRVCKYSNPKVSNLEQAPAKH